MSGPVNEWVIHDAHTLRAAIKGMKAKRKKSLEDLFHLMGSRVLNKIIRGEQENLRSDTIILAVNSLGFELVIREPQRTKTQQRLAMLRAEKEQAQLDLLRRAAEEEVVPGDRGADGKLTRPLSPRERAEVDEVLKRYMSL